MQMAEYLKIFIQIFTSLVTKKLQIEISYHFFIYQINKGRKKQKLGEEAVLRQNFHF